MKIALIGFGGMGRAVHRIALERGHNVSVIVDPNSEEATHKNLESAPIEEVDMVVDFSLGESAISNLELCIKAGKNLVTGSTGWYDDLPKVKDLVGGSEIGFLWSSNFSIGVNLYFKMIESASKMINKFDEYDIWGHEIHHFNKADSPSGTAKSLEKILLENISRKDSVVEDKLDRRREDNEIHFSSVRGGAVNFGHTIAFDSAADRITISHEARCRDGYALGAVKAAEWLSDKNGYFEMNDFLNL
jgi:4-hydroxy-tetrahydrodipicolinate reductase